MLIQGDILMKAFVFWPLTAAASAAAGFALSCLYGILPHPLSALVSPVSTAFHELLKIFYFPYPLTLLLLDRRVQLSRSLRGGFYLAALASPLFFFSCRGLAGLCGLHSPYFDLGLYLVTIAGGTLFAACRRSSPRLSRAAPWLFLPFALYGLLLVSLTLLRPYG